MKHLIPVALLFFIIFSASLHGQQHRVYFKDKGENLEMLSQPFSFLSPKALERKARFNIPVKASDLPVCKAYLEKISETGIVIRSTSRWFNYALVEGEKVEDLLHFPFVGKIEEVELYEVSFAQAEAPEQVTSLGYGITRNQVEMMNGNYLHDLGYTGRGMTIAVLDAGFRGTPVVHGLDSLRMDGRILGTRNFVDGGTNVYVGGAHGTSVLSIMAGYIPDTFSGTAIHACYYLFKTEDEQRETPVEMENWLAAAELSDSLGVDIITSSLGYYKFDGGIGDYDISDLDGNTVLVTRAADMAASKGMLVVVSAGNAGSTSWKRITAPADGDSVLAVGAVDATGNYASFSSQGPTALGNIKPEVVAQGAPAAYLSFGGPRLGNGTSFACPLVSGMAACLWQAYPAYSNMDIFNAIKFNASERYTPTNTLGFGVPDFRGASWELNTAKAGLTNLKIEVYPNPVDDYFSLEIAGITGQLPVELKLFDMSGRALYTLSTTVENQKAISVNQKLVPGTYLLSLKLGDQVYLKKIIK